MLFPETLVISGASSTGVTFLGKLFKQEIDGKLRLSSLKVMAGVSIGALISLFIVNGMSPLEIMNSMIKNKCYKIFAQRSSLLDMFSGKGVYSLDDLKKTVVAILGPEKAGKSFRELSGEFLCTAYNMDTCEYQIFSSKHTPDMCAVDAAILSCAIPFLFGPATYNGFRYVDGGLVNNFPLNVVNEIFPSEKILGLVCVKNYSTDRRVNSGWSLKDFLPLVMAATNYHTQLAVKTLPPNTEVIIISSNMPFYHLNLEETDLWRLFFAGVNE